MDSSIGNNNHEVEDSGEVLLRMGMTKKKSLFLSLSLSLNMASEDSDSENSDGSSYVVGTAVHAPIVAINPPIPTILTSDAEEDAERAAAAR